VRRNVVLAAAAGLILGGIAAIVFAFVDQVPVLGCVAAPLEILFGLGLPILIGVLATAWGRGGPGALLDGALAAFVAELGSLVLGFCASLFIARPYSFGPRFLLPTAGPAVSTLYYGVWAIGWFVISICAAALLGALGAFLYRARRWRGSRA
jgi:hypothetical protein